MNNRCSYFFILVLAVLFSVPAGAGNSYARPDSLCTIHGVVKTKAAPYLPVNLASVRVRTESGKEVTTATSSDGVFIVKNLPAGRVSVIISHVGYKTVDQTMDIEPGEALMYFQLEERRDEIKGAKKVEKVHPITMSGDTTIVNARLIPQSENDDAIELLAQIPGIKVNKKSIQYRGKAVSRTYVNGKQIFGDITTDAFETLYAKQVKQIKIFEEDNPESRRRGLKNHLKDVVIDIITDKKIVNACNLATYLEAGVGDWPFHTYHEGRFFSEMFLMKESASFSTLTDGDPFDGADDSTVRQDPRTSDIRAGTAGLEIERYWKDRQYGNKLNTNISFSKSRNSSTSYLDTRYLPDSGWGDLEYHDTTENTSRNNQFRHLLFLTLRDTPIKDISVISDFSHNGSEMDALKSRTMSQGTAGTYSAGVAEVSSAMEAWNYSGNIIWKDNSRDKFRPKLDVSIDANKGDGQGMTVDTLETTIDRQVMTYETPNLNWMTSMKGGFEYVLKNDAKSTLRLCADYGIAYRHSDDRKIAYDLFGCAVPRLDSVNTYNHSNRLLSNSIAISGILSRRMTELSVGLVARIDTQTDNDLFGEAGIRDYRFPSICPSISLRNRALNVTLYTQSVCPSLQQLRPEIDSSDPYLIRAGNPDLKSAYSLGLDVFGPIKLKDQSRYISIKMLSSYGFNSIVESRKMSGGAIVSTYENISGKIDETLGLSFSALNPRMSYGINVTQSYNRRPAVSPDGTFFMNSFSASINPGIRYGYRNLKIQTNIMLGYSQNGAGSWTDYSSSSLDAGGHCLVTLELLRGRLYPHVRYDWKSCTSIKGGIPDYAQHSLSGKIGYYVIPKKLLVGLSGHNLLNAKDKAIYQINPNFESITRSDSRGRYVMLNIRYIFRDSNVFSKDR